MPPDILIYAAFVVAFRLAVAADDLLVRRMMRNTPTGETTGHTAECTECEEWDGCGW